MDVTDLHNTARLQNTPACVGYWAMMIHVENQFRITEWLSAHSARPKHAIRLLIKCMLHADGPHNPDNEVSVTRQALARELGIPAADVSRLMGELVSINALTRKRIDGHNHYYVNHWLAHNLSKAEIAKVLADAPKLDLTAPHVAAEAPEPVAA